MKLPFAITTTALAENIARLLLRVAVAVVVFFHGLYKLTHGVEYIARLLQDAGLPGQLALGVYLAEIVAPVFLAIGLWTRGAAAIIAFDMIMAIALALGPRITATGPGGSWGVEVEFLILLTSVALVLLGGGRYAVTWRRATRKEPATPPAEFVP